MKTLFLPSLVLLSLSLSAQQQAWDFDAQMQQYFAAATDQLKRQSEVELAQVTDWPAWLAEKRPEIQDMLGLSPWPEKTPLQATITGSVEHEEFTVHNIHFQSMPGLYVTGNLYIPKNLTGKVPAIIYVCGHATVEKNGYNYGAKAHYQHHPAWFARHGYVCLILDTVQLAEIPGIHHGLYRFDRWWWISRGYTPAGVEAWNAIRAIDYLLTRPEVDAGKIGITGRSGGGVVSWWTAAVDERVKVAVPVAGITDLEDYVVNGCVADHCDCMFMVNAYQWDYPKVAAMLAPRPLLISNTDRDPLFPIEGVFRTYRQVRKVYEAMGVGDQLALNVTSGPHQDVQELRIHAFRWFDHYLYGRDQLIEKAAVKFFQPEQLRVFDQLPADAVNARIDEVFNPVAPPVEKVLATTSWETAQAQWMDAIKKVFGPWPANPPSSALERIAQRQSSEITLNTYAIRPDEHTTLPVFHLRATSGSSAKPARIIVLDDENWPTWAARLAAVFPQEHFWQGTTPDPEQITALKTALAAEGDIYLVSCRGAGPAAFSGNHFQQIQLKRRYYLLGQSLEMMQTRDLWCAFRSISAAQQGAATDPLRVQASGAFGGIALYAALFSEDKLSLRLTDLPHSHLQGPQYPNILKYLDVPAAVLLAARQHEVLLDSHQSEWDQLLALAARLPALSLRRF